jgi:hypothetical protein
MTRQEVQPTQPKSSTKPSIELNPYVVQGVKADAVASGREHWNAHYRT